MPIWIALFRGINVGGKNRMPMARLSALLESLNCQNVRTYIQSGNVVFRSDVRSKTKLHATLCDAAEKEFGFPVQLLLLTEAELKAAVEGNPFPEATAVPKSLHFFFLCDAPGRDRLESLTAIASETERFQLSGQVFYLHAPDGFGTSKLARTIERQLGVLATARNYQTVAELVAMVKNDTC